MKFNKIIILFIVLIIISSITHSLIFFFKEDYKIKLLTFSNNITYVSSNDLENNNLDQGIQITNLPSGDGNPDIYENIIVWEDYRNEDGDILNGNNADIYGYDLSTGTEFPICTQSSAQKHPKIFQDKVVWSDWRNDPDGDALSEYHNADVYFFNLTTQLETQITFDETDQYYPDIFGEYVVWVDYRNNIPIGPNDQDIYMYNLETNEEIMISNARRSQVEPDIFGNFIVWEDWRYNTPEIFYYNIALEEEYRLTNDFEYQYSPAIYSTKIVWEDHRNENADIYYYDLYADLEIQITNNTAHQLDPIIYKDSIVWTDYRNKKSDDDQNLDIYYYSLDSLIEKQISTNECYQSFPAIYKDKIVCSDNRNGNGDIYLYELDFSNNYINNHKPIIESVSATPNKVKPNETAQIEVTAFDEDNDNLFYNYKCSGGCIEGNTPSELWIAPEYEGIYSITITVYDGWLAQDSEVINITVENEDITPSETEEKEKEKIDFDIALFLMLPIIISIIIYYIYHKRKRN